MTTDTLARVVRVKWRRLRLALKSEWPSVAILSIFLILSLIIFHLANEPAFPEHEYSKNDCKFVAVDQARQLKIIENYPIIKLIDPNLFKKLHLDTASINALNDTMAGIKDDVIPVIVTATSSKQFSNTLIWLKSLKEKEIFHRYRVIIYDLGITDEEKAMLCIKFSCEIRRFPFEDYPMFIRRKLAIIAWKPLIIQMCLTEFPSVIWMDSTVFLKGNSFDEGIRIAQKYNIAVSYRVGIDRDVALAYSTSPLTFQSFGETPCVFNDLYHYSSGFIIINRTKFTIKYLMLPWVACALSELCIGGGHSVKTTCNGADIAKREGFCHRFDLSSLSIILHRLFHGKIQRDKINMKGKLDWVNCYFRRELIFAPDEIMVQDGLKFDVSECPDHLLPPTLKQYIKQSDINGEIL